MNGGSKWDKELSEEMEARAHAVSVFQYSNEQLALSKKSIGPVVRSVNTLNYSRTTFFVLCVSYHLFAFYTLYIKHLFFDTSFCPPPPIGRRGGLRQ